MASPVAVGAPGEEPKLYPRSSDVSVSEAADEAAMPLAAPGEPTFKQRVWALVDDPSSSAGAQFIAIFVMILIGVSCTTFCIETLPTFHRKNEDVWFYIEMVCIICFTLEYVTRLLSCPKLWPFLKGALNIIDLIAIVPFYVELAVASNDGGSSAVFRVVRLVRVFRVFKISRYLSWVKIFANAMYNSAQPLGMLVFVMAIGCVVFSSAIYFVERGEWNEEAGAYMRADGTESPYQSIPASFWWCIITMTTVGYGDDYPITWGGKLIAACTSLCGILVLAIPITVISSNFNHEYLTQKRKREAVRSKMMMFKQAFAKKRTGLGMIKAEIDQLVKRNATEMAEDVANVIQAGREELAAELYELVKVAYARRRKKLLASQTGQMASLDVAQGTIAEGSNTPKPSRPRGASEEGAAESPSDQATAAALPGTLNAANNRSAGDVHQLRVIDSSSKLFDDDAVAQNSAIGHGAASASGET